MTEKVVVPNPRLEIQNPDRALILIKDVYLYTPKSGDLCFVEDLDLERLESVFSYLGRYEIHLLPHETAEPILEMLRNLEEENDFDLAKETIANWLDGHPVQAQGEQIQLHTTPEGDLVAELQTP